MKHQIIIITIKKTVCDKNVFTATTGFVSRNKLFLTKHQAKLDAFKRTKLSKFNGNYFFHQIQQY